MTIDITQFKAAMRCLTGHVCLVTTCSGDGQRSGLTATAVCSVSAAPPTLLVCVNRSSASAGAIREAGRFAVNVLGKAGTALANRFASPLAPEDKFAEGRWITLDTGAPVLAQALASFDCRVDRVIEAGTHLVLFGAISAVQIAHAEQPPLLYAHGGYGSFASAETLPVADLLWISNWDPDASPVADSWQHTAVP
ncbi:flavin reductase family protein [Paraburkholderia sp. J67]|uniref:flavin reductase family protein n=1 Tax=Paraburkholderia sp. J67 TaxID=2805435 RepID=UPI002ABD3EA5|nr:flavin reductase family protein [Paraburkholderia sp. J67]